jgi:hypothetical protein
MLHVATPDTSVIFWRGVLFGLILEYVNVRANLGYTYGKFMLMFGTAPKDIPFCIGVGWGVIMYTARLLSDALPPSTVGCRRARRLAGDQYRSEHGHSRLQAAYVALGTGANRTWIP